METVVNEDAMYGKVW